MPRAIECSNEKILEIAAERFLQDGARASTLDIARCAGVSEATLFKRFKTKRGLFERAMDLRDKNQTWPGELMEAAGKNTPAENVTRALMALMDKLERVIPRMALLRSAGKRRMPRKPLEEMPPIRDERTLTDYLEAEIRMGRLTMDRPGLRAHQIIGAVVHYVSMQDIVGYRPCGKEEYVASLVGAHLGANAERERL